MRVYLSRWVCRDVETNLRRLEEESAEATGADLVVFPESFLHGYTQTVDPTRVRERLTVVSRAHPGGAFVFGSFTEEGHNRVTVWQDGRELARYDKIHLFRPNREEEIWQPGDRCVALRWNGWTLGLLTCNDVRFPEQARALRLQARCDALVVPAWWPWRRHHVWETLLRARAIENGVWTVGCCIAAGDAPSERFAGAGNAVFDPHGEPVRTNDDHIYDLDPARVPPLLVDTLDTYRPVDRVVVVGEAGGSR